MRVILIRHPRPEIESGICYGRLDVPVSEEAVESMPLSPGGGTVWTSPAGRCRVVAARLAATPLIDERLRELDFGDWEGRHWADIDRALLDRWAASPHDFAPPGGETGASLIARITAFREGLHQDCIVVSHGGPLKVLAALLRGEAPDLLADPPPLGSVTVLEVP